MKALRVFRRKAAPVPHLAPPVAAPDAFDEQRRLLAEAEPRVIFDVGAHHGQTAERYKQLFPSAAVYSFEPFPESFAELQRKTSQLADVYPINVALSDRCGDAIFNANEFSPTNSLLPLADEADAVWPGQVKSKEIVRVSTTTIDEFCRARAIDRIDLLKLDVQGAEHQVLAGAEAMIRRRAIGLIYTEIITLLTYAGQLELHEFLRNMHEYGFQLQNFFNASLTASGQLRQVDAIFMPAVCTAGHPGQRSSGHACSPTNASAVISAA